MKRDSAGGGEVQNKKEESEGFGGCVGGEPV